MNVIKRFEHRREKLTEIVFYEDANDSSILWSYLAQFQTQDRRNKKKIPPQKDSLYFRKWNFLPRKKLIKFFYAFDKTSLGETG